MNEFDDFKFLIILSLIFHRHHMQVKAESLQTKPLLRPMLGNPRQSWILDSMLWIPDSGYWIPDSSTVDSGLQKELDSIFFRF